jgi:hypothetical protein
MSRINEQRISSEHSAEDIWRVINTPLDRTTGQLVNPYVVIEYGDLESEDTLQRGALVTYIPNLSELEPVPGMIAGMLPKDVALRVQEYDQENKTRVDVVESDKHSGMIRHRVEEGLLIVEGELLLGGSRRMFEGPIASYAEQGLVAHNQRVLANLPTILGR